MRCSSLNLLYHPFRERFEAGLKEVVRNGLPFGPFETFRTRIRQSELWAQGRSKPGKRVTRARPGQSYHNYGLAVDIALWVDGAWSWSDEALFRKAGPYFELQGLTWLGRHSSDLGHIQMKTPYDVETLQTFYDNGGLEEVWIRLDHNL